ncbi:uncharacterized protein MELLADRAFT_110749 [Melampsora larici-populina 98AG31]|uniref:Uncharacterized protein n=1 Tax=Melampsora larici-populina (strain 98AG31 / pathotype 3-4-7) TaxID=747676 RepID=F4S0U0_MELLP|nr:uncharacterized protein MELLADRAFT_110749 [Melampsora larici-populina 98AG31]EGG01748.1 hypothetical protein MELLADRAFT_110749 [Melampsora larici-populina 98AG31]
MIKSTISLLETSPSDHILPSHSIQTESNLESPNRNEQIASEGNRQRVLLVDGLDGSTNSLKPFETINSNEMIRKAIGISKNFSTFKCTADHHEKFHGQNY